MKIIYNNLIPFKGFLAINLFGVVFVRNEYKHNFTERTKRHEYIHTLQQKELLYIGFYLWYLLEWIYRLIFDTKNAYRNLLFEKEARMFENYPDYPNVRKKFNWWKLKKQIKTWN